MSAAYTYDELIQELDRLYDDGQHQAGLDLLLPLLDGFTDPVERRELLLWQVALAAQAGQLDLGVTTLAAALDEGHWYPPVWLTEEDDFAPLHGREGYERLVAVCTARVQQIEASIEPFRAEAVPSGEGPHPLLLALHGNESSAKGWVSKFRLAVTDGWLVALPQSSQVCGPDKYIWDDRDRAVAEVTGHFSELQDAYAIDAEQIVIGGFSMGAETALFLALTGQIPARGVIAVIPGGPYMADPDQWTALLQRVFPPEGLRVYLIAGLDDHFYAGAVRLAEILDEAGIACELVGIPEMGHDLPPNFRDNLKDALNFIMA
ncbi:alpha/beta hydrolase [Chloroflexota bacterium]